MFARDVADTPPIQSDGLEYFKFLSKKKGFPEDVTQALLDSINPKSLCTYRRVWKEFAQWFDIQRPRPHLSPSLVASFLLSKFKSGSSTSYVNTMRSAINFFSLSSLDLENNTIIKRLFKYFYRIRPLKPKYSTFWPVAKLLNFLKPLHPPQKLTLKELTLKTVALVALTSSDRGQTLHLARSDKMVLNDNGSLEFLIHDRIKSTRRVIKPKTMYCCTSKVEELNVAKYVQYYLESTMDYRNSLLDKKLFISWITKKPVTSATIGGWLKTVLHLSGIDTNLYTAHSYRGAGLSKAHSKGASPSQIISGGNWSNIDIFENHYHAPTDDSELGRLILDV